LRLSLTDFDPDSEEDVSNLTAQYNLATCTLHAVEPDGSCGADITADKDVAGDDKRKLMGTLSMSPFVGLERSTGEDRPANSRVAVYFLFHDLSCRALGRYRLQFRLCSIDPIALIMTGVAASLGEPVTSDIFEVFSAKDYPGVRESTALTKELKRQGATVSIKKGSERRVQLKHRRDSNASSAGSLKRAQLE
jgi:hypothetical protein